MAFGILAEGASFRTAVKEANPLRGDRSWWRFIKESTSPELPVVLLEDFGAMIGLSLAFGAIITSVVTDNPIWDGIGTLSIGILLGVIAIVLVIEMKSLLLGESASEVRMNVINDAILASPHVTSIIHIRTQYLGPEELLLGAKVAFDPGLSVSELAAAIDDLEVNVRAQVPFARPIYIDSDLRRELPNA